MFLFGGLQMGGSPVLSLGGFKNSAAYTVNSDSIRYPAGTITATAKFSLTGDTMNFTIGSSDQKFEMKRGK